MQLLCLIALLPCVSGLQSHTQEPATTRLEKCQAKLEELRQQRKFPGATFAFVGEDGFQGNCAVGFSDIGGSVLLKPEDRMLAGSIGKTYVAAVAMHQVAAGKLNLDQKISQWLGEEPWFKRLQNHQDITVRSLLRHTSGVTEHVRLDTFHTALRATPLKVWKPEELLSFVFDLDPLFEVDNGWSYADTNYILTGMVLERIDERSFYAQAQELLLDPLKLKHTIPSNQRKLPGLVAGYPSLMKEQFGMPDKTLDENGLFAINPQLEWTGGGFCTNSMDLALWAKRLYEGQAFDSKLLAQMLDGVPAQLSQGDKYGLGVILWSGSYGKAFGHSGWFPGYLSEMAYFPDHKLALAIQFNTDNFMQVQAAPRSYLLLMMEILMSANEGN